MIQRFFRALWLIFNTYSFYRSPIQYVISVVLSALIPILFYTLGGVVALGIFFGLIVSLLIWFVVKKINESRSEAR